MSIALNASVPRPPWLSFANYGFADLAPHIGFDPRRNRGRWQAFISQYPEWTNAGPVDRPWPGDNGENLPADSAMAVGVDQSAILGGLAGTLATIGRRALPVIAGAVGLGGVFGNRPQPTGPFSGALPPMDGAMPGAGPAPVIGSAGMGGTIARTATAIARNRRVRTIVAGVAGWALVDAAGRMLSFTPGGSSSRRMNVLNPKALTRANRRVCGFASKSVPILKALGYQVSTTRKHRGKPKRKGGRCR